MSRLDIPVKKKGDPVPHEEYNAIVTAINSTMAVERLTTEAYFKLPSVDENTAYLCLDKDGLIEYYYIGSQLIAKRDKGNGPTGFPSSFPIVF